MQLGHKGAGTQWAGTQCGWDIMRLGNNRLGHNRAGTQWGWDIVGLGHNRATEEWDWDTRGRGHNGTETQWDWDTMEPGQKTSYFALPEKKVVNNYYYSLPMVTFEWSVLTPFLSARAK